MSTKTMAVGKVDVAANAVSDFDARFDAYVAEAAAIGAREQTSRLIRPNTATPLNPREIARNIDLEDMRAGWEASKCIVI